MDEEEVFYLILSLIVIFIAFGTLQTFGNGWAALAALLALLTVGLLLIINWADFLVFPLFTKLFGITFQPAKDYTIVKRQDSVVKNVSGLYYATGFITANLFPYIFKEEQQDEAQEEKLAEAPEKWERAVMTLSFPFKFHVISVASDVQKVRDELEAKRGLQEFQLNKEMQSTKQSEIAETDIRRKINIIQARIDRISTGEKPISSLMYIETTAVGISEKSAVDSLASQIKELQVAFSSLDIQLNRIVGRELYTLLMFNFSMPTTFNELSSQFSKEG